MTTALYRDQLCQLHDAGPGHPERPARLRAIDDGLHNEGLLNDLALPEPSPASREQLQKAHSPDYLDRIFGLAPSAGLVHLDGDTAMNKHSLQTALLAAGSIIDATDEVLAGRYNNAFCSMRPPGHHAEYARAMGFCLFGNIAVGALHALDNHELDRVAILDFDVHHGNGTEDIVRCDPRVLFCSSFQHPFYPYSNLDGAPEHVVHSPLSAASDSAKFRAVIERDWFPAVARHRPQMIFVSAGFDAHREDPLGGLLLEDEDFAWITRQIRAMADDLCDGRIVSALEGGYDLEALGRCVSLHLAELMA